MHAKEDDVYVLYFSSGMQVVYAIQRLVRMWTAFTREVELETIQNVLFACMF